MSCGESVSLWGDCPGLPLHRGGLVSPLARTWDRHGLGDPGHVRRSIERLLDLGLVETIPGPTTAYRVTDTFVAAWLRRIGVIVG